MELPFALSKWSRCLSKIEGEKSVNLPAAMRDIATIIFETLWVILAIPERCVPETNPLTFLEAKDIQVPLPSF